MTPGSGIRVLDTPRWLRAVSAQPGWVVLLAVAASYVLLAQYVIWLNNPVRHGAGFWPAAGFTVASLLLLPRRHWPWVLAGVVFAETAGDTLLHGYPLLPTVWWAAANALEPLVAATLLTRLAHGPAVLTPPGRLASFIGVAVIGAPGLAAVVGTTGTWAEYGAPFLSTWVKFAVGDGIGVLVVAPALLALAYPPRRRPVPELLCLLTAVTLASAAQFADLARSFELLMPYMTLPILVWAGMRFGVRGAAFVGFIFAQTANAANALGLGAAAIDLPDGHAITLLQLFIGIAMGTGLFVAALSHSLADRSQSERRLAHDATHDELTGLLNRQGLRRALATALHAERPEGRSTGVLYLDLDNFKEINDTFGHACGDAALGEVARRLRRSSRSSDTIGRWGGDEFVIVCPDTTEDELGSYAGRLLEGLAGPVVVDHTDLVFQASIGAVIAPPGERSPDALLRSSDRAMYAAKQDGGGRTRLFGASAA